jgi:hypothetical protein
MNAKQEFLDLIKGLTVVAVEINLDTFGMPSGMPTDYDLKEGHSITELEEFLDSFDFDYDEDYGTQHIYGTVWFESGMWAERGEYNGSEWWSLKYRPDIPDNLKEAPQSPKSIEPATEHMTLGELLRMKLGETMPPPPPELCHVL